MMEDSTDQWFCWLLIAIESIYRNYGIWIGRQISSSFSGQLINGVPGHRYLLSPLDALYLLLTRESSMRLPFLDSREGFGILPFWRPLDGTSKQASSTYYQKISLHNRCYIK